MTTITRVGYCPHCANQQRPHRGSIFLCYGTYRGDYYARDAGRNGIKGYTPHLFDLEQVTSSGICIVSSVCAMYGCGVEYRYSKEKKTMVYAVINAKYERIFMPITEWNALLKYRRDPQYML